MKTALLFLFPFMAQAGSVVLTEALIKKQIQLSPPSIEQVETSFLQAKESLAAAKDQFSYRFEAEANRSRSKERQLNEFIPVTQRASAYSVGIVKPTQYGVQVGASLYGDQFTNNFVAEGSTIGGAVSLTFDLYKDFLGKSSRSNLEKAKISQERAELEKEISYKTFEANVRKMYWSLVANAEAIKITEKLLIVSREQLKDGLKRQKASVAEAGEIARYRAQISSRTSSLLSLKYQRAEIIRTIKELLPDLAGKNVVLGDYSIPKTIETALRCSAKIASHPTAPLQFTPYDEINQVITKEEKLDQKLTKDYDAADIKLIGEYNSIGKDFGYSDAIDDFTDNGRPSYSVGLQVTIPLGSKKKTTEDLRKEIIKRRAKALRDERMGRIEAFHTQTAESIRILNDVIANQQANSKHLSASLKETEKKYRQARATVQDLVIEQDALLQSSLDEIQTKQTAINTLIDYFSVYTTTPCELNRI